MKTQILELRSGTKNQYLNDKIDYNGYAGTNDSIVAEVWEEIKKENPEEMTIEALGYKLLLIANWSLSRKSVTYSCIIPDEFIKRCLITPSKKANGTISIAYGNIITVHNGKKSYTHLCPSLIKILHP